MHTRTDRLYHRPLPRLSLTPRHRHQRLQWCRIRLSWRDSEWQRVIFSDESRCSLGGDAQRIRVWRHRGQHQDGRSVVTHPEGLVSLHLHPYRTICRNCVRMFKLHGMDYHRTPSGTSTASYRDVWRVGLANTAARRHTERQTSAAGPACDPQPHLGQVPVVIHMMTAHRNGEVLGEVAAPTEAQSSRFMQLTRSLQEPMMGLLPRKLCQGLILFPEGESFAPHFLAMSEPHLPAAREEEQGEMEEDEGRPEGKEEEAQEGMSVEVQIGRKLREIGDQFQQDHLETNVQSSVSCE
ncbi:hypothetical protein NFI96_006409 [Prochilodus magdalenae]|nr:hypothetical protein NFI96_006409 [Prochilodus magdalenae]